MARADGCGGAPPDQANEMAPVLTEATPAKEKRRAARERRARMEQEAEGVPSAVPRDPPPSSCLSSPCLALLVRARHKSQHRANPQWAGASLWI